MSQVNSVEHELNTDDRELMSAASRPATTRPLKPTGSRVPINVGNAASVCSSSSMPFCDSA